MRADAVPSAGTTSGEVHSPKSSIQPSLPWATASRSEPRVERPARAGAVKSNWASGWMLNPLGPSPPTNPEKVNGRPSGPRCSAPAAAASPNTGW